MNWRAKGQRSVIHVDTLWHRLHTAQLDNFAEHKLFADFNVTNHTSVLKCQNADRLAGPQHREPERTASHV